MLFKKIYVLLVMEKLYCPIKQIIGYSVHLLLEAELKYFFDIKSNLEWQTLGKLFLINFIVLIYIFHSHKAA